MTADAATGAPTPGDAVCLCGHPSDAHVDLVFGCKWAFEDFVGSVSSFCRCSVYRRADHDRASEAAEGGQG